MELLMRRWTLLLLSALLTAGCLSYDVGRYGVSLDSSTALKKYRGALVNVGAFTAAEPGRTEIGCRSAGPVATPGGSFEEYIRKAFIQELTSADLYSPSAPTTLTGRVNRVDFDSLKGEWQLDLTVTSSNGKSLTVADKYSYGSTFAAIAACERTAQAFVPAVQSVISRLVSDPTFAGLGLQAAAVASRPPPAPAAPPRIGGDSGAQTAAPRTPGPGERWAVVIGVGDYDDGLIPQLAYPARDAEAVHQFLTTQGGYAPDHVQLLTDATATKPTLVNIKRALGDFLGRRAGPDDTVFIFYAGHGAFEVDASGTEADGLAKYLIPRDADSNSLYTSALPMDEIQKIFSRIRAERVVLLLDTCYSGTAGGRTFSNQQVRAGGVDDRFLERLTGSKGRVIITASGANEVALESRELRHGIFTYYVLEGLRGKADGNKDGDVTVSELYEYVQKQVERHARESGGRQRPIMKGEMDGSLPLVRTGQ